MDKIKTQKIFSILIIIVELVGLYFQIYPNKWYTFTYYTVLSNLIVLGFFIYNIYILYNKPGLLENKTYVRIKAGVTATILMTFFTFSLLLLPRQSPEEIWTIKNFALHFIAPILAILDWFLFDKKGLYRKIEALTWTIIPLIYLIYSLIRAIVFNISIPDNEESPFPYFFLNIYKLGIGKVVSYCILILLIFMALSYLMYFLKLSRKSNK